MARAERRAAGGGPPPDNGAPIRTTRKWRCKLPCDVPNPFVSMETMSWPTLAWAINLMCKQLGRLHCAGPRKQASKLATVSQIAAPQGWRGLI
eukprot:1737951-Pyramimonas_sp.AAC.1